ncbi:MAG TPA: CpsD/CapB family tyrosine-protein kinase [Clostridia bacterium]|nr:CpsD/CapB family tyrosine-protein kinase [Clostridia bacterium]
MFSGKKKKEMESRVLQEAFRVLKSNIMFCGKEGRIKTITITSCSQGEGKTTIALKLAKILANSEFRTLLVDAEFRKQRKQKTAENEIKQLASKNELNRTYPGKLVKDTTIKNLYYLSLGSSLLNPEMLIDSAQLKSFILSLSEGFDVVLVDAPPLGGAIDSAVIAANTDAAILVVQSGMHDYRTVLKAKEQLDRANVRLIGAVLSKINRRSIKTYLSYQRYCRKSRTKELPELEKLGITARNGNDGKLLNDGKLTDSKIGNENKMVHA